MASRYHPAIDGLRAIAVLSVIFYHMHASWLGGGFLAVDIFFVVSGYVITESLQARSQGRFVRDTLAFYSRRILRIAPALFICVLITLLATALFIPPSWWSRGIAPTALAALMAVSNYILLQMGDSYFAIKNEFNPLAHTWALGIEEQFYMIFPWLFFVCLRPFDPQRKASARWLSVFLVLVMGSFLLSALWTTAHPEWAFYSLPTRFWELGAGALLLRAREATPTLFFLSLWGICFRVLSILVLALTLVFGHHLAIPYPATVLAVAGALLFIASFTNSQLKGVFRLLEHPWIVWVGKLSYSLYLWHWPVVVLFRWTVGLTDSVRCLGAVAVMTLFSIGSYYGLERPIRYSQYAIRATPLRLIVLGLVGMGVSLSIGSQIMSRWQTLSLSEVSRNQDLWVPEIDPDETSDSQDLTHSPQLFAIGDSHAGSYTTMLNRLGRSLHMSIQIFSTGGCPIMNLIEPMANGSAQCQDFYRDIQSKISRLGKPGDILFLSSFRLRRLMTGPLRGDSDFIAGQQGRAQALAEAIPILQDWIRKKFLILIEAPLPVFGTPFFRCSDWFNAINPDCREGSKISRSFLLDYRKPITDSLAKISTISPDIRIWDPFDVLCPTYECSGRREGKPLFYDEDHLSRFANLVLYPKFEATIREIESRGR
jgi:peptidoglycan/LPS O-acetylase OafA/YrhL